MRKEGRMAALLIAFVVMTACGGPKSGPTMASSTTDQPTSSGSSPVAGSPVELLTANFDRGPGPFTVTKVPEFSIDVVDGTYRIRILTEESYPRSYAHLGREAEAVAVLADVVEMTSPTTDDPDLVGVGCGNDTGDGYYLTAENNGGYTIMKKAEGKFTDLRVDILDSIPGSGRVERLRLTCVGAPEGPTKLVASINGSTIATVNDPQGFDKFTTIALTLAADRGTEARFDNVVARVPESQDL